MDDFRELVSSLEDEAREHRDERVGELCALAAEVIMALRNRASELESDVEDLMQELATIKAARLRLVE